VAWDCPGKRIIESIGPAIRHAGLLVPFQDLRPSLLIAHKRLANAVANEGVELEAHAPLDAEEVGAILQDILVELSLGRAPGGSTEPVGPQWSTIATTVTNQLKKIAEQARLDKKALEDEIAGGSEFVGLPVEQILDIFAQSSDVHSREMCMRALAHHIWKADVSSEIPERGIQSIVDIPEKLKAAMDAAGSN